MDFPEESIKLARWIAGKYKKRSGSKLEQAANLYDGKFIELKYGFNEAIKSGNCGRYFHEITKEANCFDHAGVMYLVARECGLKPKLYSVVNGQDTKEGQDVDEAGGSEHAFITVEVGKGKRQMIDPLMSFWGRVKFLDDRNEIQVYQKSKKQMLTRKYESIEELSEDEYIRRLESHRKKGGGRIALTDCQSLRFSGGRRVYVQFNAQREELSSSTHMEALLFVKEPYNKVLITEINTKVSKDGDFDLWKGRFSWYFCTSAGWTNNKNPQAKHELDAGLVKKLFGMWDKIVIGSGRKTTRDISMSALEEINFRSGFRDDFKIERGSLAEKVLNSNNLMSEYLRIREGVRESVKSYVDNSKADEVSMKTLARDARYTKLSDAVKSKDNLFGLIYTPEERLQLLRDSIKAYKRNLFRTFRVIFDNMEVHSKLKRGSIYKSGRRASAAIEKHSDESKYYGAMEGCRKLKSQNNFNICADISLFRKNYDIENMSVEEVCEGLRDSDLLRAGEAKLFQRLLGAYGDRDILSLRKYHEGLKKVLAC